MAGSIISPSSVRPNTSKAVFNLPSSDSSSPSSPEIRPSNRRDPDDDGYLSNSSDDAPLPFPAALPRSDFLAPNFEPAAYLSSLPHRHQTLEDLRGDLRERSAAISAELVELVNANYTAFLSLGAELRGGGDKIEDVKVALLGFRRGVEEIRAKVRTRKGQVGTLNRDLKAVRSTIASARDMLEVSERLTALEDNLLVQSLPRSGLGNSQDDWSSDDSEEGDQGESDDSGGYGEQHFGGRAHAQIQRAARECCRVDAMLETMDDSHPFVQKMHGRLLQCRHTLLLDLGNATREARNAGEPGKRRLMQILAIYRALDVSEEAVKILKTK